MAGPHNLIKARAAGQVVAESLIFAIEILELEESLQTLYQLFKANRLHQIVEGSGCKGFNGILYGRVRGDNQHEHRWIDAMKLAQDFYAVAVGKLNVTDPDIVIAFLGHTDGFGRSSGGTDFKTFTHQELSQSFPNDGFIFNNQNRLSLSDSSRHGLQTPNYRRGFTKRRTPGRQQNSAQNNRRYGVKTARFTNEKRSPARPFPHAASSDYPDCSENPQADELCTQMSPRFLARRLKMSHSIDKSRVAALIWKGKALPSGAMRGCFPMIRVALTSGSRVIMIPAILELFP